MPSTATTEHIKKYLQAEDFDHLFIDVMGWDDVDRSKPVLVEDSDLVAEQVSDKKGVGVWKIVTEKEGAYEDVVSGVIAELNQKRMTSQYKEEIRFILLRLEADGVIEESGRIYRKV